MKIRGGDEGRIADHGAAVVTSENARVKRGRQQGDGDGLGFFYRGRGAGRALPRRDVGVASAVARPSWASLGRERGEGEGREGGRAGRRGEMGQQAK